MSRPFLWRRANSVFRKNSKKALAITVKKCYNYNNMYEIHSSQGDNNGSSKKEQKEKVDPNETPCGKKSLVRGPGTLF
jgi:hypothetical protein